MVVMQLVALSAGLYSPVIAAPQAKAMGWTSGGATGAPN